MKNRFFTGKRVLLLIVCLTFLSVIACACQTGNEQNSRLDIEPTPISDTTERETTDQWKNAYLNFLEQEKDTHLSYALVYIDGDDIPELYLSGDCEATGDSICAYINGTVVEQPLHRIGGGWYIEKSGYFANQNGHMGHMYTDVYKLTDAGFEQTFDARLMEILADDEFKISHEYSVGGQITNETDYKNAIHAAFDFENAVRFSDNSEDYGSIRQRITDCE